jgi:hypothetical protein
MYKYKKGGYSNMDGTIIKTDCPQVKLNTINNLIKLMPVYHKDQDTFYLRGEKPHPATSYDLNGIAWLRVDVESGEIVGLQIDDFETVFLKKYPELTKAWKEFKPLCTKPNSNKNKIDNKESFILIIINFLVSFFKENPTQESFSLLQV